MGNYWFFLYGFVSLVFLLIIARPLAVFLFKQKKSLEVKTETPREYAETELFSDEHLPNKYELMEKSIPIFDEIEKYGKGIEHLDFDGEIEVEECFYRADDYILLGKPEKAIGEYKKILEITGNHFDAFIGLGDLHATLEQLEEAAECFKSALKIDPKDDAVHVKLAKVYEEMGARGHAYNHYNLAYDLNKSNAEALAGIERHNYLEHEMLMGGF